MIEVEWILQAINKFELCTEYGQLGMDDPPYRYYFKIENDKLILMYNWHNGQKWVDKECKSGYQWNVTEFVNNCVNLDDRTIGILLKNDFCQYFEKKRYDFLIKVYLLAKELKKVASKNYKKYILELVEEHYNGTAESFQDKCCEIAQEFEKAGESQLTDYILSKVVGSDSFSVDQGFNEFIEKELEE